MNASKNTTTRQATEADFVVGNTLIDAHYNTQLVILNEYDEGIYEARVFDGSRIVGEKVIFTGEARFYQAGS